MPIWNCTVPGHGFGHALGAFVNRNNSFKGVSSEELAKIKLLFFL